MTERFTGIIPPLLTPFNENEEVDEDKLRKLVNFLIDGGVHGLFPCGSIGEFSNLTTEEMRNVQKITVDEADGRVPVLAGTGASGTKEAVRRTINAEEIGADGVINVTPFYLESDQVGIREHFSRVAESTSLPILLYHIPQCTGQHLSSETISSLYEEYENIVGLKDSSGDLGRVGKIIRNVGNDFQFFQGRPKLLLPSLILGAAGGVPGTANIKPEFSVKLFEEYEKGNIDQAKCLQLNREDILSEACSIGPFPANYKSAAKLTGFDLGPARSPIRSMNKKETKEQKKALKNLELLD